MSLSAFESRDYCIRLHFRKIFFLEWNKSIEGVWRSIHGIGRKAWRLHSTLQKPFHVGLKESCIFHPVWLSYDHFTSEIWETEPETKKNGHFFFIIQYKCWFLLANSTEFDIRRNFLWRCVFFFGVYEGKASFSIFSARDKWKSTTASDISEVKGLSNTNQSQKQK